MPREKSFAEGHQCASSITHVVVVAPRVITTPEWAAIQQAAARRSGDWFHDIMVVDDGVEGIPRDQFSVLIQGLQITPESWPVVVRLITEIMSEVGGVEVRLNPKMACNVIGVVVRTI